MFQRTAITIFTLVTALVLVGEPNKAQASSFSTWVDANYDFEVYWGTLETVYDLYVVFEDGSEQRVLRSRSYTAVSDQMQDFGEGWTLPGVVRWYVDKERVIMHWNFYSTYDTRAKANGNADWIESMGLETDIRLVYNPIY